MVLEIALIVLGWVMPPVCTALVAAMIGLRRNYKAEKARADKAEAEAAAKEADIEHARVILAKASARKNIFDAYEKYVINGVHLTIARYEELLEEYEAYTLLGGNGTAKRYMDEIIEIKPYLVTE